MPSVNFIELYNTNRESFNIYLKQFHKEYPGLDLFTCELILRTKPERAEEIIAMYERGELKDPDLSESGKTFVIESATIPHPDDDMPPTPINVQMIKCE